MHTPIASDAIERSILSLHGQRVLLDATLAAMYGVEVRILNQAVKRNLARFPADFAFRLTADDMAVLKSQFVISKAATHGGARRALPMAFTEQGVAMLSGVLHSPRAIAVNVEIMRAFVRMRQLLAANTELARKLAELEARYDQRFQVVFDAIRQLMEDGQQADGDAAPVGFRLET
jgi:hypothetical protein